MYGHAHANNKAGSVEVGLSVGSGGTFDVMSQGGGSGSSVFSVNSSGDVTVGGTLTLDSVSITEIQKSSESFTDSNVFLMTAAAIDDRINSAVTGGTASSASSITVVTADGDDDNFITFANGAGTSQALEINSKLSYNPDKGGGVFHNGGVLSHSSNARKSTTGDAAIWHIGAGSVSRSIFSHNLFYDNGYKAINNHPSALFQMSDDGIECNFAAAPADYDLDKSVTITDSGEADGNDLIFHGKRNIDGNNATASFGIGITPKRLDISTSTASSIDLKGGAGILSYSKRAYMTANAYHDEAWKSKESGTCDLFVVGGNKLEFWVDTTSNNATANANVSKVFDVASSGAVTSSSNFIISDKRLKSEIQPIKEGLETIKQFTSYNYIKGGEKESGFIAQEVQKVIPHAVAKTDSGYLSLNDSGVLAHMHKAILELEKRLISIEEKLK